ncbi:hypothetical protein B0F90DRAFT_1755948 [Multifurca ochricompacta]|uniref:Uncharacterized protein n=1 Tax=Multifurca ochricompacta TaxID=376703 RepID=A0AAD4LYL7_9AGAM|nr:hypothetical protein B0F90DRAFT_1755948 [Multifurca ochricompacta]
MSPGQPQYSPFPAALICMPLAVSFPLIFRLLPLFFEYSSVLCPGSFNISFFPLIPLRHHRGWLEGWDIVVVRV